ncbi:DNA mismatch repair endonuclease MutL [Planctellipticum variicoloris]|uniref:DNA mismatch repair endonuclease MutL n=1 Tax=Planctellipticum variicoloris TaxID=3064265 RepID=UPI00301349B7|nr:DNA mismatch repair endonuclease MutL [Planctomycetaceae bacterium SH412]
MSRIQQLSASVINKIAAGEVIERPASVVKELVENSLDALATRIEVDIVAGGAEVIRIVDDGEGIHPDDLLLAVTSHATSKIRSADELFSVQTMGFRGEAMASIAEVSRLRIRSRQADAEHGMELKVDLGAITPPTPAGCPLGTQIEIRNLFENTPVRRKFLKSPSTEFGHISEQFTRIALANPRLHMVLRHNDKVVYELSSTQRVIERLELFFGADIAEQLIEVESEHNGVRMWGYVGHPALSKATRKQQYLFLNGRWIQDRTLQHALTEAYRGLLMVGRQPIAFLFIEIPPETVDVNVHPTKIEVRFQDAQQLFRQLLSMIRSKFLSLDLQSQLKVPTDSGAGSGTTGGLSFTAPRTVDPAEQQAVQREFVEWAQTRLKEWTPDAPPQLVDEEPAAAPMLSNYGRSTWPVQTTTAGDAVENGRFAAGELAGEPENRAAESPSRTGWSPSAAVSEPERPLAAPAPFGPPRALQIHDCYLVIETAEGMSVIDQHALHERIMYEYFRPRVLAGKVESQHLLVPQPVELSAREAALVIEQRELLARLGLGIEEFGKDTLLVNRYPVMLAKADLTQLVRDLAEMLDSGAGQGPTRRDLLDELLHMMSCKAAVKAGQRLTPEEIDSLLEQRHLVDDAHHCPHGRPTALNLSRAELDRQFGRLG